MSAAIGRKTEKMKRISVLFLIMISICSIGSAHILNTGWWDADITSLQYARYLIKARLEEEGSTNSKDAQIALLDASDATWRQNGANLLNPDWESGTDNELRSALVQLENHILGNGQMLLGYSSSSWVENAQTGSRPERLSIAHSGTIDRNGVNIRNRPGGGAVERVNSGTTVEIIDSQTDSEGVVWAEVVHGKVTGYVRGDMLKLIDGDILPGESALTNDTVFAISEDGSFTVRYIEIRSACLACLDANVSYDHILKGLTDQERKSAIDKAIATIETFKATTWWAKEKLGYTISEEHEQELIENARETVVDEREDMEYWTGETDSVIISTRLDIFGDNLTYLLLQSEWEEALQYCIDNDETFEEMKTAVMSDETYSEYTFDSLLRNRLLSDYLKKMREEAHILELDRKELYEDLSLFDPNLRY